MIKRFTVKDLRVTFTAARIKKVIGVNSEMDDGQHIVMWDFDDVPIDQVTEALKVVQARYMLSDIYILKSSEPRNYIAYCFSAWCFRRVAEIVTQTDYVDWNFIKYGIYRGRFTLRVTPKLDKTPYLVGRLEGKALPDCGIADLNSWVRYETLLPHPDINEKEF